MWIFCEHGFFSAVMRGRDIVVRARVRAHLDALRRAYPRRFSAVIATANSDYPYRVRADRDKWASVVADVAREIDYDNFKGMLHEKGQIGFEHLCHEVWRVMYGAEAKIALTPPKPRERSGEEHA